MTSRTTRVGVVLVHYHTPELARDAVEALLLQSDAALDIEIVVVDNGSTPEARALLDTLPARVVGPGSTTGYAGGVNKGVAELPDVDVHVLANPDVLVQPGCLAALVRAMRQGAAVVGPRFFWDRRGGWLLPPTEAIGRREELLRVLASIGGGAWATRARRRWRRHARRHWSAEQSVDSVDLSGAMLAVDASIWSKVGGFDESYPLYFEETDWLQRVRAKGFSARHVPTAEAIHLYAQSTPSEPRAQAWFSESQERFRRRHYGRVFSALLRGLGRGLPSGSAVEHVDRESPDNMWPADATIRWIELSPSPGGFPAAGLPLASGTSGGEPLVPETIWERLAAGSYWLRAIDDDGHEVALRRVERQS